MGFMPIWEDNQFLENQNLIMPVSAPESRESDRSLISRVEAKRQFDNVINAHLIRCFKESDLDIEEFVRSAFKTIEDSLDKDAVEF